ncbi:hypothetical protein [Parafrankia sp. FMc2]|uniref:hypothetical protein n=1 Tax=Parafrankia sp. FMc2 TaxID=3233196 RepID=UPI0034D6ACB4
MSGRELSRRFYEQSIRQLVWGVPHAAALLGKGSEVLGLDDEISTDHDFGPRVQLFVERGSETARSKPPWNICQPTSTAIPSCIRSVTAMADGPITRSR